MYNYSKMDEIVLNLRRKIYKEKRKIVFVCIGTNRVAGDSLGPLVGSYLKSNSNLEVFGDLSKNICEKKDLEIIRDRLKNRCVVAIDSAISDYGCLGEVFITSNPLKVAVGLNNDKGIVGDISIKGIVAENKYDPYENFIALRNSNIDFIQSLAIVISQGIKRAIY